MQQSSSEKPKEVSIILAEMRAEVDSTAFCYSKREGLFRAVLKASFVRSFDYVEHLHLGVSGKNAEGFFACAPLRQCCEDLIALKYLSQLTRSQRDEVVTNLMIIGTSQAIYKQTAFFRRNHPFQPILSDNFASSQVEQAKNALTDIGRQAALWRTEKKLPPIEQMARNVDLGELYEFLYAATSEIVHFNVRIALRSGWGDLTSQAWKFSSSNFSRYYLAFAKYYGIYVLIQFSRTFGKVLSLSKGFRTSVNALELWLQFQFRWPEIVTFEEMNQPLPDNIILQALLHMKHKERVKALEKRHRERNKGI